MNPVTFPMEVMLQLQGSRNACFSCIKDFVSVSSKSFKPPQKKIQLYTGFGHSIAYDGTEEITVYLIGRTN